jgi:hypothetical protein
MDVCGQPHGPGVLPPGKTRYPLHRKLSGPQEGSGKVRKISSSPGFDSRTVEHVANRFTHYAIPVHVPGVKLRILNFIIHTHVAFNGLKFSSCYASARFIYCMTFITYFTSRYYPVTERRV